jgi:carbon-monoxide dehydrogenase small subunit
VSEQEIAIRCKVNGEDCAASVPARLLLSDFIRHDLGLTGTHVGCEHGVCGACTIILDGRAVRSCLMLAAEADGSQISTVEGLARPGEPLNNLQEAFHTTHGLQCGFCTPGILMSLTALLNEDPQPSEEEVVDTLNGHLCRCTGYRNIVKAAQQAIESGRKAIGRPEA